MFFPKNQSSELFLDLSEEQQETVAGGKVYENNKVYYIKKETSDGGNTDSDPQIGKDKSIGSLGQPDWLSSFEIGYHPFEIENQLIPKIII